MISSGGYAVVSSFGQYLAVGVFVWRNNDLISVSVSVCRKLDIVGIPEEKIGVFQCIIFAEPVRKRCRTTRWKQVKAGGWQRQAQAERRMGPGRHTLTSGSGHKLSSTGPRYLARAWRFGQAWSYGSRLLDFAVAYKWGRHTTTQLCYGRSSLSSGRANMTHTWHNQPAALHACQSTSSPLCGT